VVHVGDHVEGGLGAVGIAHREANLADPVARLRDQPAAAELVGYGLGLLQHVEGGFVIAAIQVGVSDETKG